MHIFIINLQTSSDRRVRMECLLRKKGIADYEFIEAVDGRKMSEEERHRRFDVERFLARYSIDVRPGEIGCTLSHQECYRKMVSERIPYVLILEDDICFDLDIVPVVREIEKLMSCDEPRIILLSGWYWYTGTSPLGGGYRLANVYDAFLTHSYVINLAAARQLIEERPYITADDWRYIRKKGGRLEAVCPHLIDQDWTGDLVTTVNVEERKRKGLAWFLRNSWRLLTLKLLYLIGHFEKA